MIYLNRKPYPYMEEVNEGIPRQFSPTTTSPRVLDIGCGRGQLGEAIKQLGWEVWGVENNSTACATARTRLDRLIERDLTDFDGVTTDLRGQEFDAIVFSDVLEHLYDPRGVLEHYLPFLKTGGKLLISVPNTVVWTNRLKLMMGQVTYTDTGVMDRTHIRMFTFRTTKELVRASGCTVDYVSSTPYLVRAFLPLLKSVLGHKPDNVSQNPRALIDSNGYKLYMKWIYPAEHLFSCLWRTMFAFRIIVVATKPVVSELAPQPAVMPSRQLQTIGGTVA